MHRNNPDSRGRELSHNKRDGESTPSGDEFTSSSKGQCVTDDCVQW